MTLEVALRWLGLCVPVTVERDRVLVRLQEAAAPLLRVTVPVRRAEASRERLAVLVAVLVQDAAQMQKAKVEVRHRFVRGCSQCRLSVPRDPQHARDSQDRPTLTVDRWLLPVDRQPASGHRHLATSNRRLLHNVLGVTPLAPGGGGGD